MGFRAPRLAVAPSRGQLLALLYRAEYAEYADVFVWLMVASGVFYVASFLGYGMTAARYFKAQAPLFFAITVATVAACAVLVPGYGLIGAAFASLISMLAQLAGSLAVILRALRANGDLERARNTRRTSR
jgi:O-antigen/teichoic acid export membrane protein